MSSLLSKSSSSKFRFQFMRKKSQQATVGRGSRGRLWLWLLRFWLIVVNPRFITSYDVRRKYAFSMAWEQRLRYIIILLVIKQQSWNKFCCHFTYAKSSVRMDWHEHLAHERLLHISWMLTATLFINWCLACLKLWKQLECWHTAYHFINKCCSQHCTYFWRHSLTLPHTWVFIVSYFKL